MGAYVGAFLVVAAIPEFGPVVVRIRRLWWVRGLDLIDRIVADFKGLILTQLVSWINRGGSNSWCCVVLIDIAWRGLKMVQTLRIRSRGMGVEIGMEMGSELGN